VKQFPAINQLGLNAWGQPIITNAVGSLDVDIIFDEGPDVANLLQDAYEMLRDDPTVPWQIKLELMPMPASIKKSIQAKMQPAAQQAAQKPDPKVEGEQIKAATAQRRVRRKSPRPACRSMPSCATPSKDQAQAQVDQQMERERAAADRDRIRMEMERSQMEHQFKREELAEQRRTMQVQHAQRRKQAMKPKKPQKRAA
jgi:hypothetical protein